MAAGVSNMKAMQVEVLERKTVYRGFFRLDRFRLRHSLFEGGWSTVLTRELFERGHAAAVLAYDPDLDAVVLLEQFRIGALEAPGGPWLVEIIAGVIEPGEAPEQVVLREAVEEAGCTVTDLIPVCDYLVSPGGTSERIALYCGRVDAGRVGGIHGLAQEGEDIRVSRVDRGLAMEWLAQGRINSASIIIALQWLELHREEVLARWNVAP